MLIWWIDTITRRPAAGGFRWYITGATEETTNPSASYAGPFYWHVPRVCTGPYAFRLRVVS